MKRLFIQQLHSQLTTLPVAFCALFLLACGSESSQTVIVESPQIDTPPATTNIPENTPITHFPENTPISLAQSDWPVIHQNNAGTKASEFETPMDSRVSIDKWTLPNSTVLSLIGDNYIYHQAATGGKISAFKVDDLAQGPVHEMDLEAVFRTGGGLIDSNKRLWWTADDKLVRLDEDLSGAILSQAMQPTIADSLAGSDFPYINGITLLSDSNILVTSVGQYAWIISTTVNENNELPIVQQINWQDLTVNGSSILAEETRFSPRPIIDEEGNIVIVSVNYMLKLNYNSTTRNFDSEVLWAFANPENISEPNASSLAISHAVKINDLTCVASAPMDIQNVQQVYCVNAQNGQLAHHFEPFPAAFGARALHTLGGLSQENWLVTIVNSNDNSGGMRVYDLHTGLALGERITLNNISEAFVISTQNKHAYISHKIAENEMAVLAVDLKAGSVTHVYQTELTDPRSISSNLAPSLSAMGEQGLYIPLPDGLIRISSKKETVWQGNTSLGDEDWLQQWGLVAWDPDRNLLSNGFWGENDLDVVANPYNPDHLVLRIHYPKDGVTVESGVGMLFFPEIDLEDPKKACLSYKQLFDTDFDFGTVGGKLPGLYGFDTNSDVKLDATTCSGPYAYNSDTCFSARLGYRNLSSIGHPETTMFYEVIPWMDETECRDSWICDLPYGEGMTMKTAVPESFTPHLGQWDQIQQEIKLNDQGESNGYIRIWYKGELVVDERNLSITTSDTVAIKGIMFHSLFGQGFDLEQGSPVEQVSYIADMEIANSCAFE